MRWGSEQIQITINICQGTSINYSFNFWQHSHEFVPVKQSMPNSEFPFLKIKPTNLSKKPSCHGARELWWNSYDTLLREKHNYSSFLNTLLDWWSMVDFTNLNRGLVKSRFRQSKISCKCFHWWHGSDRSINS